MWDYKTYFEQLKNKYEANKLPLIPGGGTINWLINCDVNGYDNSLKQYGYIYDEIVIDKISISEDSKIEIVDLTQPRGDDDDVAPFCTKLAFYKREINKKDNSYDDRPYNFYYPYGTRFDNKLLEKIGKALSMLMNKARDLEITPNSKESLNRINKQERLLIDLLLNGTNDENAVDKIIGGVDGLYVDDVVRKAKLPKDLLPYFTCSDDDILKEYEEYKLRLKK